MAFPDRITVATCIGCGMMERAGTCAGGCREVRFDVVPAADVDELAAAADAWERRAEALRPIVATLAAGAPAGTPIGSEADAEAAFREARVGARAALVALGALGAPPPAAGLDEEPLEPVTTWWCPDCGGLDAPQPCIGICIRPQLTWADAALYVPLRERALAARGSARNLEAIVRALVTVSPREGAWRRNWQAITGRAQAANAATS